MIRFCKKFILIGLILIAGGKPAQGQPQSFTISGLVRDAQSGESLPGANVYVPGLNTGTSANNYGFYSLTIPAQKHTIIFSFVGYNKSELEFELSSNSRVDMLLQPSIDLEPVVITANANPSQLPAIGTIHLPLSQVRNLPALLGEKDIMKTLQLMPGIQRGREGTGGLFVRGGGYDQNLIILDDASIYNANHLFGFFSLFNGDAIKDIKMIKGGFPARYGGRLSSVLDITMKEGNLQNFTGEAGLGLISSRFTFEGPVKKDKASFLLAGRRTYLDWIVSPFLPKDEKTGYYFYDLNAKINYIISEQNRIYVSSFLGKDELNTRYKDRGILDRNGLNWQNALISIRLNSVFSSGLFMNNTFLFSRYNTGFFFDQTDTHLSKKYVFKHTSGIQDYSIKTDLVLSPALNHTFRFGTIATIHDFRPRRLQISNEYVNDFKKEIESQQSFQSAAYVENEYRGRKWMYNIGLRLSYYSSDGLLHLHPEPRISFGYRLTTNSSIKASYTDMNQYIHLLSTTGGLLPTDIWLPATGEIEGQNSKQVSFSYDRLFSSIGTELTIEAYYKKSSNVITYRDGANFFFIDDRNPAAEINWVDNVTGGNSKAFGFEVLLHKKTGKVNGWMAYTWSKALVRFNEINSGEEFPASHDRRHDFSLTMAYAITPRVHISSAWVFMTGNPLTLPFHTSSTFSPYDFDGEPPIQQKWLVDYYGVRNNYRTDIYHRLDISLRFTKPVSHGERDWEIGFYNAYNKKNAFAYTIANQWETGKRVLKKTTIFPLIPSVTYVRRF